MNPYYNRHYTREDVERVLSVIRRCIKYNRFTISLNEKRPENIRFMNEYNLRSAGQRRILLGIRAEDFCYSLQNTRAGYTHETLYVFAPRVWLTQATGERTAVDVYVKCCVADTFGGTRVAVVSFHERSRPVEYLFK